MGLPKGRTNNLEGRPAGIPNKITTDLRDRIEQILDVNFTDERIKADLIALDPEKRLSIMIRLLEFALPKLRSTELTTDLERLTDEQLDKIIDELKNVNYETVGEN